MSYDNWPPNPHDYNADPYARFNPPPWAIQAPRKPLRELTLDDPEEWMPIEDFLGLYAVSSHGRVFSYERTRIVIRRDGQRQVRRFRGGMLRLNHHNGYPAASLSDGQRRRVSLKLHWLVAEAFIGPRPDNHWVLHADDRRNHNAPANLRYGTPSENAQDAFKNGRNLMRGKSPTGDDLPLEHASAIRALKGVILIGELARTFARSPGVISMIGNRRHWLHAPEMPLEEALQVFVRAKLRALS